VVTSRARGKLDPRVFDFASVIAKTKSPKPKSVSVFLRPDLIPRIEELAALLDAKPDDAAERSVSDQLPEDLYGPEYDQLVAEFNDSEIIFDFRATKFSDKATARAAMTADGHDLATEEAEDVSVSYMLAQTCESASFTGAQFHEFREKIGEAAFLPLLNAALEANSGPGVSAPFSRRPSPGLTSEK
jgi:hypothetical protein